MIIQFCGLSGSGKTTLALRVKELLRENDIPVEIIDGDVYRKILSDDLGFSKEDRNTNIRRLAFVASKMSVPGIVAIICTINPYDDIRKEISELYPDVKTVFIDCDIETVIKRDTKGLYSRALLPDDHPDKIHNLTGINDPFEIPQAPDLVIKSDSETVEACADRLLEFILFNYKSS
ncbi:MAG TPA: adenylyl-sulfate kinase [Flavipsychrobacter sp.]|nr:adenylyl-sulfate kinase [Flavipsychrobacter sp.]